MTYIQHHRSNPTGIKKINKEDVDIILHRNENASVVSVSLEKLVLEKLNLPEGSSISLIAYSEFSEKRIAAGEIGNQSFPKRIEIEELNSEQITFRIIVRDSESPILLASCEGIKATQDGEEDIGRKSFLPVCYKDLGQRLWELSIEGGSRPELLIHENYELEVRQGFESKDSFIRGIVVPQAVESALFYVACNPPESDDSESWQSEWTKFSNDIGADPVPFISELGDLDEALRWARETASRFADDRAIANTILKGKGNIEE